MKIAYLALTLALTLPAIAHAGDDTADARERAARGQAVQDAAARVKDKAEDAWDRIEDAGADLRDGVVGAIDDFIGSSRNLVHERPELKGLPHLIVLRKGQNVKIAYCRPLIAQIFRDRRRHPGRDSCDQVLTKGSFNIGELQACSVRHSQEGGAAFNLQRQLARVMERNEAYTYNFEAMYGSRDEYRDLFRQCSLEISAKHPAKRKGELAPPAPVAPPPAEDKPEFKPVDHSHDQPAQELNGTLGTDGGLPALNPVRQ